ncbi:MAG: hypothetical protein RLN88_15690 [Ekhidna sp.]|uniref:hypothetical protein n=1 Tax=Ekhidna sp. TaxID=2608089 RepID=UPI0032EF9328
MKKYFVKSENLNNSLVFYRALFDRMPDRMGVDRMQFTINDFQLEVIEGKATEQDADFELRISDKDKLEKIGARMSRFKSVEKLNSDCEVIDQSIGLIDPDGYRWVVGNPEAEVRFEKCYVTN